MKSTNKNSQYTTIMRNAARVVKRLIESGATYTEIRRAVNEMASPKSGWVHVDYKPYHAVENVWGGNYKKIGSTKNDGVTVYYGCRYDVNHPDWQNLPSISYNNLCKGTVDEQLEKLKVAYVCALVMSWRPCPDDITEADNIGVLKNVIHKYDELGGSFDDIRELYDKVGENGTSWDDYQEQRKNSIIENTREEAEDRFNELMVQMGKEPKDFGHNKKKSSGSKRSSSSKSSSGSASRSGSYYSVEKDSDLVTYNDIPELDFSDISDIVDVPASDDDLAVAADHERRIKNGGKNDDNNDSGDNTVDTSTLSDAEIADSDEDLDERPAVGAPTEVRIENMSVNPEAEDEIAQAMDEIDAENAENDIDDDDDLWGDGVGDDVDSEYNDDDSYGAGERRNVPGAGNFDDEEEEDEVDYPGFDDVDINGDDSYETGSRRNIPGAGNFDDDDDVDEEVPEENDYPAFDDVNVDDDNESYDFGSRRNIPGAGNFDDDDEDELSDDEETDNDYRTSDDDDSYTFGSRRNIPGAGNFDDDDDDDDSASDDFDSDIDTVADASEYTGRVVPGAGNFEDDDEIEDEVSEEPAVAELEPTGINLMSGNLEEYNDPAKNEEYAAEYPSIFELNDKGEIGAVFKIEDNLTDDTLDTVTIYRNNVAQLLMLNNIFRDFECDTVDVIVVFDNEFMLKNVTRVYKDAMKSVNKKWNNKICKARDIAKNEIANTVHTVDELKKWFAGYGEVKILDSLS